MMSIIVMQTSIFSSRSQVSRRPKLWREFTSSMTEITTFQLRKLVYLTRNIRRLIHWQELYVSLTRLTRTSILRKESYSGVTLDWYILGSNICNGYFAQDVWRCKKITRKWPT